MEFITFTENLNSRVFSIYGENSEETWEVLNIAVKNLIKGSGDGSLIKSLIKNYLYCSFYDGNFCKYILFLLNSKISSKDRVLVLSGLSEGGQQVLQDMKKGDFLGAREWYNLEILKEEISQVEAK